MNQKGFIYTGNLLQTVNYYPSGVPFTLTDDDPVTDRLHTGKPFIDMQGLGYYDNNARFLDILTGSFISVDPLAGKYPSLTPYNHCANNPLTYIDINGDSIAVLNLGGIIGHSAMLIQDENNKWKYYSVNEDL